MYSKYTHTEEKKKRYEVMFRKLLKITNSKAMKKSWHENH